MALELRTKDVIAALAIADERSETERSSLLQTHSHWADRILWLLEPTTPLTYLPVLTVCLVVRSIDDSVDVRRIQAGDEYSASLVGRAVVDYARDHGIDMRTDSTNVMNSQPFLREPEITSTLSTTPAYAAFFDLVEQVQLLEPEQATDVLAIALIQGRANWPNRKRRVQRNQGHGALELPMSTLPDVSELRYILAPTPVGRIAEDEWFEFDEAGSSTRELIAGGGRFVLFNRAGSSPSFVGAGRLDDAQEASGAAGRWRARVVEYEAFSLPVSQVAAGLPGWKSSRFVARIAADDFERIVRLGSDATPEPVPLTVDALRAACMSDGLSMPDHVLASLVAALDSGKHVVLTGPPGTAKTSLAVVVARLAGLNGLSDGNLLTTATADWSTFDTIGGLSPRSDGTLAFRFGSFLQALEQNRWLIVDEMNRANFDRAFGPLFTVLAGQDVLLQYAYDERAGSVDSTSDDERLGGRSDQRLVRLRMEEQAEDDRYYDVVVRNSWRMIGTINNFDKSLLFEMSFALMRRFAFVEVPSPTDDVFIELAERVLATDAPDLAEPALKVVRDLLPMRSLKDMGPAIFLDAVRMARRMFATSSLPPSEVTLRVFYALLLPQFEGIDEARGRRLAKVLAGAAPGESATVLRMLREVLGLDLGRQSASADPIDEVIDFGTGEDVEVEVRGGGRSFTGLDLDSGNLEAGLKA